jgi:hypothetical protein
VLRLRKPPHQNTIGQWTNDPRLTPILERMLAVEVVPNFGELKSKAA